VRDSDLGRNAEKPSEVLVHASSGSLIVSSAGSGDLMRVDERPSSHHFQLDRLMVPVDRDRPRLDHKAPSWRGFNCESVPAPSRGPGCT